MSARFVASATTAAQLPVLSLPEVAVVGRSNVGKSSLIGKILGAPRIVRTSRTPGRTQTLNLFELADRFALVDLPGYGFAKLSRKLRQELREMMFAYIAQRGPLCGVVLVLDARRDRVSADDREMASWVLKQQRLLLLAVTKIDLVPKNRRLTALTAIEKDLGVPSGTAVSCSAKTGEGKDLLVAKLREVAGDY